MASQHLAPAGAPDNSTRVTGLRQTFVITLDVPEGVSRSEVADHLADAHRMAVRNYHASDPLSQVGEIEVLAALPSSELPASIRPVAAG